MKYACCKSTVDGTSGSLSCTTCKLNYHVACLYSSDKRRVFSAEQRRSWLCPGCSLSQPRTLINDNTPIRTGAENVNVRRGASCIDSPTQHVSYEADPTILETVKNIIASEMSVMRAELRSAIAEAISREVKPIIEEIASIRESMSFINDQHEIIMKIVNELEKDSKSYSNLKSEIGNIKKSMAVTEADINKQEQWARRSNV
ncbi:unnamed protein product [Diatraea saccharalis]|uniref:Zinc finger PHD-type domain-containing protein n=1 Tax=Diatraea saccharalis TaxID=40085 RepID=A0A9N9WF05_9NEOP|nr:unnamed protein product [Diatraea saccharalis]